MKRLFFKDKSEHPRYTGNSGHYWFIINDIKELHKEIPDYRVTRSGCTDHLATKLLGRNIKFLCIVLPMDDINMKCYIEYLKIMRLNVRFYGEALIKKFNSIEFWDESYIVSKIKRPVGVHDDNARIILKRSINSIIAVFDTSNRSMTYIPWLLTALHRNILRRPDRFNEFMNKVIKEQTYNKLSFRSKDVTISLGDNSIKSCVTTSDRNSLASMLFFYLGRFSSGFNIIPHHLCYIDFERLKTISMYSTNKYFQINDNSFFINDAESYMNSKLKKCISSDSEKIIIVIREFTDLVHKLKIGLAQHCNDYKQKTIKEYVKKN